MKWEALAGSALKDIDSRTAMLSGFMLTSSGDQTVRSADLPSESHFGVWRVESIIGAGGMGIVFEVQRDDGEFQQRAALKLMQSADPDACRRFATERERVATLEHHGISRIIDGGTTDDGRPYMVVEFVQGEAIDAYVRNRSLSRQEIARLLCDLLTAVGHAHERLILHRDVKASNVLIDEGGRLKLIDFGVASLLDTDEGHAGPLTLAYSAPEMLAAGPLTVGTDLFAAGVLAHKLFTGELPGRQADGAAVVDAEALGDQDLAAILAKATKADPDERYTSAAAFADDLEAFVERRPVEARGGGRAYRTGKFLRRYPIATALSGGLVLALLTGMISTTMMADRANAARGEAERALATAERNYRVQEAYGDALHRAFGGEGNTERVTAILLDRAAEAYALRAEDPERAAEITFALGRNFVERNDYKTASEVLQPWIDEGFGDPELIAEGKLSLALALRYQGQPDAAAALFKEVVEHYEASPDDNRFPYLVAVVQLTTLSSDTELQASTMARLQSALAEDGTVEERAFLLNSLAQMRRLEGDFSGAEEATKAVHELLTSNPLVEIAGREAILGNKAMYATFVSGDLDTARQDVDTLINDLSKEKGESSLTAYAFELSSAIALQRGDFERAVADGRTASQTAERLSGPGSAYHRGTTSALAEALVGAGRYDEAKATLDQLAPLVAETRRGRDTRYSLARAFYLAKAEDPGAASEWLRGVNLTTATTDRTPLYKFRMDRLERLGVEPAPITE